MSVQYSRVFICCALSLFGHITNSSGANILGIMGVVSPSIHLWTSTLMNGLALKGHNVTVLSTEFDENPPPNVHYIYMEGVKDHVHQSEDTDFMNLAQLSMLDSLGIVPDYCTSVCEGIRRSDGLQILLNYPDNFKFDLIVNDFSCGPCLTGFVHKFNYPPLVGFTSFNNPSYTVDVAGGHNQFAYKPYYISTFSNEMSFWQRFANMFFFAVESYYRDYHQLPVQDQIAKDIFGADYPPVSELERLTQIALVSTHPSIIYAEPLPPNVIPVGGLQIKDPKPLPKNIDDFITAGKDGTVLFSLGTNILSKNIGIDRQKIILEAFKQLQQYNFLWKFETDFPLEIPPNVLIQKWMPQNDILSRKNLKAFVTHGGSLSTFEATWHAVPMIGIPFIVDQYSNVHSSVVAGVSEQIDFRTMTSNELKEKLVRVLTDPSYAEKTAIRSRRLHDQPEKPLDRAVWWIEYMLRNPDVSHLRVPTNELGFIRANCLDLYAILLLSCLSGFYMLWKVVRTVFSSARAKSTKKDKTN